MRVLVVASHLDDEILGPGGTLCRHGQAGDEVLSYVACCGTNLRYGPDGDRKLRTASAKACEALGFQDVRFGDFPDQGLDTLRLVDIIEPLRALLNEFRPEVLYSHDVSDLNRDHRILHEALCVAARPYAAPYVRRFACFETPSTTEWGRSAGLPQFDPNLFVEISGTLEAKIAAFAMYESEVRRQPHPRALEALRARAIYWGSVSGFEASEPFRIVREKDPAR